MGVMEDVHYERQKRVYLVTAAAIAVGLAIAGSVDRTIGGAVVLAAWAGGVMALHRLGRAGSQPR